MAYDATKRRAHYLANRERVRQQQREYYAANRDRIKTQVRTRYREMTREERLEYHRRYNLKKLYGITLEDYEAMFEQQGGVCALCGEPAGDETLAVDHCHESGQVRGLLHRRCNRALGTWEKVDAAARVYLGR